ncbi:hypothetical protein M5D96_005887 [Drosophila gunungcola]|uniref:Uncharacterized protein n=1 Tax=Drosophila gunungcola TaxID=103775 RepID=A0A9P9YRA6_9MUSC|nr:hypothetical protein M5D96_005887 [Drosophila gunungcola]
MKYSTDALNQSVGSISIPQSSTAATLPPVQTQNAVSVHHASPALPQSSSNGNAKSVMKLPVNGNVSGVQM